MAAVIFTRTQVATFAGVITATLALLMAVPSPYAEGVAVDHRTGAPVPDAWHRLQQARATGDAAAALFLLRTLAQALPDARLVVQAAELLARELEPLALAPLAEPLPGEPPATAPELAQALAGMAADRTGDAVAGFFGELGRGLGAVDARAAELLRRRDTQHPPALGELLALAAEYGRRGRQRAQWRWLTRAFGEHPESPVAVDGLLDLLIAHGRHAEALAVTAAATADRARDLGFQRRLAQLNAWLGHGAGEAQALERLVAVRPEAADRGRLVEIYTFLGEPQQALPHAIALADGAAEIAAAETAAESALAGGFVDEGLGMLERAAARAVDPTPWLRRLAELALQDLRVDGVVRDLERVAAFDPAGDDRALEGLYRRTDRPAALADLLQRRLARTPEDAALWDEVVALRYGLGDADLARTLAGQRRVALADPARFLADLPPELRTQAADARRQALSLTLAGEAQGTIVGDVLERLRPFLAQPEFRAAAEALLERHKDDPRAKPMRIDLLDYGRTPVESVAAAADLAATYPDDPELVRLWIERASWADLPAAQRQARERMLRLEPDDRQNRHALADLCDLAGDRDAATQLWRDLVAAEGVRSTAAPRLVDALFAAGVEDEALQLLQALADDPAASVAQRLQAAEELFFRRGYDRAKVLYASVLHTDPDEPTALLRLGQVHAWTNDPAGARPFFEQRLQVSAESAPLVQFYLGETLWATGEPARARQLQRDALAALEQVPQPDFTTQSLIATMRARLGRRAEAAASYRALVGQNPRDVDLVLDYLDVLVGEQQFAAADTLLRHARALQPDGQRLLRLEGEFHARRGDYAAADEAYSRAIERYGAEAGICSDQGQARYQGGDWDGALASFRRWLQLQADSAAAQRASGELGDLLADAGIGSVRTLRVGRDRLTEVALGAVLPFDDRLRAQVRIGRGDYRGVAAAFGGAARADDGMLLDLALEWRTGSFDRFGIGLSAVPGLPGPSAPGLFAAAHLQQTEPFASLELRLGVGEPWSEPIAALLLGGRRSSLAANAYRELPAACWLGGGAAVEALSIDPDGGASARDVRARGELSFGHRFVDGDVAIAAPFQPRIVPAGPSCPYLRGEPGDRAWLVSGWLSWQVSAMLDDAELPSLLPLLRRDDNVLAAARIDRHIAPGLGCSVGAHVGRDMLRGNSLWGAEAALTWRPAAAGEVTLSASHGSALGRAGGGDVDELRLEAVLRW